MDIDENNDYSNEDDSFDLKNKNKIKKNKTDYISAFLLKLRKKIINYMKIIIKLIYKI